MLDVFDSHVFGDDFIILCEDESNFAFFLVNKNLEQIYKFPGMGNKEPFVSPFEHVEIPVSIGNLSFDVTNDRLPQSLKAR